MEGTDVALHISDSPPEEFPLLSSFRDKVRRSWVRPSWIRGDYTPAYYTPQVVSIGPLHRKDENVQAPEEVNIYDFSDSPPEEFPLLSSFRYNLRQSRKICAYYTPQVVCIGPLHRKDENVQASEGLKTYHMNCLFSRMHTPKLKVLESCVRKVYSLLKQIKACYASWVIPFHDTALVEMMLVDACFILEFMLQNLEKPYIRNYLLIKSMLHDLVLVENQIPFFVLDQIFQCTVLTIYPKASLVELLVPVLSCNNLFKMDINIKGLSTDRIPDILGFLHYYYRPQVDKSIPYSQIESLLSTIDRHKEECVPLKPLKYSTSCLLMNYSRLLNCPTPSMPVLCVDDRTESILWNFIAYEQSCADKPYASHKPITSYIYSICMLTRTGEDVAKLIDSGVLVNHLGSNEAVASIFNTILQYENKLKPPNKNCDGSGIWMRSTYVGSPWNIIALLAVVIMFALVVAQTIFTTKYAGSNKSARFGGSNKWTRFLLFG